ncbi:MAG TPA: dipeptidase [Candidatus Binatia bacterium]
MKTAREIHEEIVTVDTHVDFSPADFTAERNYTQRLETQVNLPKMSEGGLDGVFFVVFTPQARKAQNSDAFETAGYERAYRTAVEKFDAVHRLTDEIAPDQIGLARSSVDLTRIHGENKKVALIGIENGYPIATEVARIQEFYDRGARYMSLAHNGHNQLSDSHTGEREGWQWNGLSPLGKEIIVEMNRVGMMVDVSHASRDSMMQSVEISRAPLIASHSAIRALCNISRNMDDEQMSALKQTGGVMQIVAYGGFLKRRNPDSAERTAALEALRKNFNLPGAHPQSRAFADALAELESGRRAEYEEELGNIEAIYPGDPPAGVSEFMDHIDYAVKLIGIDHVGIASDFEGGGGIVGWNDASETFNVTAELFRRGYSENEIQKLWGQNILRVMDEVQRIAKK